MSAPTPALRLNHLAAAMSAVLILGTVDIPAQEGSFPRSTPGRAASHSFGDDIAKPSTSSTTSVTNCNDSGSGSLRQVIGGALSREHVDLTALTCSTISLTSGEIPMSLAYLEIDGPVGRTLTITSNGASRIFHDTGTNDQLTIRNLTISGGKYYSPGGHAKGGCIGSYGAVILHDSIVSGCIAAVTTNGTVALGGAISATFVGLYSSVVTGSRTIAAGAGANASGGGINAFGGMRVHYSTLSGNSAYTTATGASADAGGANVVGSVYVYNSTVDSNQAPGNAGIRQQQRIAGDKVVIQNSTISNNSATLYLSGAISVSSPLQLSNSTVAFNSSVHCAGVYSNASVIVQSSIVAKNAASASGGAADLCIMGGWKLTGSNNLIVSSNVPLAGTLTSDPKLVPLGNHGDPTRTLALSPTSPAIDHGNDIAGGSTDQRGNGFARVVGAAADIGAYERQVNDDEIFYDGCE